MIFYYKVQQMEEKSKSLRFITVNSLGVSAAIKCSKTPILLE